MKKGLVLFFSLVLSCGFAFSQNELSVLKYIISIGDEPFEIKGKVKCVKVFDYEIDYEKLVVNMQNKILKEEMYYNRDYPELSKKQYKDLKNK